MKEETKFWTDKADEDFLAVETLLQSNLGMESIICFHCQQAAEKYLKAYLVEHGIEFPRTHDLMLLIDRYIQTIDYTFHELKNSAVILTEFAVVARYPDAGENIDIVTARNAYVETSLIRAFILAKINNDQEQL